MPSQWIGIQNWQVCSHLSTDCRRGCQFVSGQLSICLLRIPCGICTVSVGLYDTNVFAGRVFYFWTIIECVRVRSYHTNESHRDLARAACLEPAQRQLRSWREDAWIISALLEIDDFVYKGVRKWRIPLCAGCTAWLCISSSSSTHWLVCSFSN